MLKGLIFFFAQAFLLFTTESYACMCNDLRPLEEHIKSHAFIAHVKIVGKAVKNDTTLEDNKMRVRFAHEGDLAFEIIGLFKGDSLKSIKEYDVKTSCEIGIYPGEEWVIFASYDPGTKIYSIGGCTPGRRLRNRKGEKNWDWDPGGYLLRSLREFFKHPDPELKYDNGTFKKYYQNGNLEWEAEYSDHELKGRRNIYYADGKICVEENFVNGKHDGSYRFYNNAGQLIKESTYDKGRCVSSRTWNDYTTDPLGGHFIKTPEYKGKPATAWLRMESHAEDSSYEIDCKYYRNGSVEREAIYNYRDGFCIITNYLKSGEIHYRTTRYWVEKKEFYQQWNVKGRLEMDRVYVDGKLVESKPVH